MPTFIYTVSKLFTYMLILGGRSRSQSQADDTFSTHSSHSAVTQHTTATSKSSYKYANSHQFADITRGLQSRSINNDDDLLTKIAISDFEEIQERHRLIKYDKLMADAENSFIQFKRSSAI